MTYVEEAINSCLLADELFYEEILEQVNVERDFMLSCFENNIILEAEAPSSENKGSWIKSILETIKRVFEQFLNKLTNLVDKDGKWISENVPKISKLNYNGLSVELYKYFERDTNSINNLLTNLQKNIDDIKINDSRLKSLQTREDIEKFGEFGKITKNDTDFSTAIKKWFMIDQTPETVVSSGLDLRSKCIEMGNFLNEYNTTIIPFLKAKRSGLEKSLKNVQRELDRNGAVSESFCILENAYYTDTELSMCYNSNILFEADQPNQTSQQTGEAQSQAQEKSQSTPGQVTDTTQQNKSTKPGQVVDNRERTNDKGQKQNKNPNIAYYNYKKIAIQLNLLALTSAITHYERRYVFYTLTLRNIFEKRGPKK